MIFLENITKIYQHGKIETKALNEVTLTIKSHEIFGVIGESGSGKSTLLRMINTLEVPDSGEITVNNLLLNELTEEQKRLARKKIGMIFQQFNLLTNQTVFQNVHLPLLLENRQDKARVKEVLNFVHMTGKEQFYPKQLSGGEKQRVAIARALIHEPELLLCDEPTSALDGQHADDVAELLREINRIFGTTIVLVSHELSLIKQLCDRTAILEKGSLVETIALKKKQEQFRYDSYYERVKESLSR